MPRQQTIRINQGYRIDSKWEALALACRALRRLARVWWRYRTETGVLALVLVVHDTARKHLPPAAAWWVTAAVAAVVLAWPRSRRVLFGRLRCAWTRRRLLVCLRETRVATSTGRLPRVLRSRATPAGERLTLSLHAGQSVELLDARVEELRAAVHARDVTVTRNPARADRVTVEVLRRDLLGATVRLPSPLTGHAAVLLRPHTDPTGPAAGAPAPDASEVSP